MEVPELGQRELAAHIPIEDQEPFGLATQDLVPEVVQSSSSS